MPDQDKKHDMHARMSSTLRCVVVVMRFSQHAEATDRSPWLRGGRVGDGAVPHARDVFLVSGKRSFILGFDYNFTNYKFRKTLDCFETHLTRGGEIQVFAFELHLVK